MDVLTAVKGFERLTGKPVTILDDQIREYGVTAQEIAAGRVRPSRFLAAELAGILTQEYRLPVDPPDEADGWDFLYRMMEESPAFHRYCQEAHDNPLIQMNELDNETLERMLSLLRLDPDSTAVDVGCGNGALTELVSDRTGARLVGIDLSPVAIRLAGERTKGKRERLAFRVGDINRIGQALADCPKADAIMALEVLYAASDLPGTIRELAAAMGEQGRMLFIANQHIDHSEGQAQRLRPEGTDVALAITGLGLPLAVTDLTENKVRFLERSIALLEKYRAIFEEEGSRDFWAGRILYDRRMLRRVEDGLTRRFMYYVSLGGRTRREHRWTGERSDVD